MKEPTMITLNIDGILQKVEYDHVDGILTLSIPTENIYGAEDILTVMISDAEIEKMTGLGGLPLSIQEALNSGDGTYRP